MNKSVLTIPHSYEAEQAVLGSIIYNNQVVTEISDILTPDSFHDDCHRHIFNAMLNLIKDNKPIDEVILGEELEKLGKLEDIGGYAYLAELVDCAPSSGNIIYYANIIQEDAVLRNLITTTSDISRRARDPQENVKDLINESISEITSLSIEKNKAERVKDILLRNFSKLEEISKTKNIITGVATGYSDLDLMTHGLQPSDLIVLAARPSMGKTALALNIATYAAIRNEVKGSVLIFSLEMSKEQLGIRLLTSEAKIDNKKLHSGNLEQEDWDKLARATDVLATAPLIIDDRSNLSPLDVISTIKFHNQKEENGLNLVVVDYIGLMHGDKKESREQQISGITRALKGVAKELNIPIIALSQLNRQLESRPNKRPQLFDLRESGSIEQDADVIIFIYRDEMYNEDSEKKGIAEIIIRKHRNGPIGTVELAFIGKHTKFVNLSQLTKPMRIPE